MSMGATLVTYSKTERIVWTRGQDGVCAGPRPRTSTRSAPDVRSKASASSAATRAQADPSAVGRASASVAGGSAPSARRRSSTTRAGTTGTYCSVDCRKVARREQRRAYDALKRVGRCADCGAPTSRDKEHPGEYAVRCADCHLHPRRRVS